MSRLGTHRSLSALKPSEHPPVPNISRRSFGIHGIQHSTRAGSYRRGRREKRRAAAWKNAAKCRGAPTSLLHTIVWSQPDLALVDF